MMRTVKERLLMTLAATLLAAVCGAVAGYGTGRAVVLRLAQGRLWLHATRILGEADASSSESRQLLATLNSSHLPYCSDAEIEWFRMLVFHSEYIRGAGRMRDGKIDCSTMLGRAKPTGEKFKPDFSQKDSAMVYRALTPFQIPGVTVVSLQLGNSFVTFNPYLEKNRDLPPMHYTVTVTGESRDQTGQLLGSKLVAAERILTKEGVTRQNESLYATRCAPRFFNCFTAYMSIPEALQAGSGEMKAYIALGSLTGAIFGFFFSLLYRRRSSLEQQLRRAVRDNKLRMVYQPIVELENGRIVGAEALARWADEDGTEISPEVFVRIAEELGFVSEISRVVTRDALRDFAETLRARPDFHISVNVAATDLSDPLFLPMLEESLKLAQVAPQSLIIEITESSTARHHVAIQTIHSLRQRGHQVHIDDFGTGYSSLSYLKDLAVDAIKIDQSFTRAIGTDAVTVGILPQIIAIAHALNLRIIVEGIETIEQASYFVGGNQVIHAQGWLFGRPMPCAEFHALLAEEKKRPPQPSEEK